MQEPFRDARPSTRQCTIRRQPCHSLGQASRQAQRRASRKEPSTGSSAPMATGFHWKDAGERTPGRGYSHRRGRGAPAGPITSLGAAVVVYFLVTCHVLCRQSRTRCNWRTCCQYRARRHATVAPRRTNRGSDGCTGGGTMGRVEPHGHFTAGGSDGQPICQDARVLADGALVPECSSATEAGPDSGHSSHVGECTRSLQLCSLDCSGVAVSQCAARTWGSLRRVHSSPCLDPGSGTGSGDCTMPIRPYRTQPYRQQRTVSWSWGIGSGFCLSCLHAHIRGVLLPWVVTLLAGAMLGLTGWSLSWFVQHTFDWQCCWHFLGHRLRFFAGAARPGDECPRRDRHAGCGPRRSRKEVRPLRSQPTHLRRKGLFLLWMLLTPSVQGVQVWRQATLHGQPVFNTGTVPGTRNLQDLRPVRLPNLPVVGAHTPAGDEFYREICVFAPDLSSCYTALLVYVRLRGRALEVCICRALGRQAAEWECCRLHEALPALPPEQYVLRRLSVSWHLSVVPVDLRPIGGRVALPYADRVMPCGAIAHMAIADQPGLECPEDFLCRTSQGWFQVEAALLLLPHCDAFQVWPLQLVQSAPPPSTLSLLRQASGSDHFAGSLEPTEGVERALSSSVRGEAVDISRNGLVYVNVDGFADRDSIRSSVLFAYLGPSGLGIEYGGLAHFARVIPPLPDLPSVQFVAGCCEGHHQPTVVDLRAIRGSLHVCCTEADATPAQRIEAAIVSSGEPDPADPVGARLCQGSLQVLHREQVVSPFTPLLVQPPTPLVVLPRRPHVGAGWEGPSHTLGNSSSAPRPHSVRFTLGAISLLSAYRLQLWWAGPLLMLVWTQVQPASAVQPSSSHQVGAPPQPDRGLPSVWQSFDRRDDRLTDVSSLASATEHVRLAAGLFCSPPGETLRWHAGPSTTGVRLAYFRFVVWAPHCQHVMFLPSDSTFAHAHDMLGRLRAIPDRGKPALVQPQAFMHAVQFVSPPVDPEQVTVLVDTGRDRICLDVSRRTAGASILSALRVLCPRQSFQLDPQLPTMVRNGHVVLACGDTVCSEDVGAFVAPPPTTPCCPLWSETGMWCSHVETRCAVKMLVPSLLLRLLLHVVAGCSPMKKCSSLLPISVLFVLRFRRDTLHLACSVLCNNGWGSLGVQVSTCRWFRCLVSELVSSVFLGQARAPLL